MIHIYRKKLVLGLLALILVFSLTFLLGLANFSRDIPTLSVGLPPFFENLLIMILSIGSIMKVIYELYVIEERGPRDDARIRHDGGSGARPDETG